MRELEVLGNGHLKLDFADCKDFFEQDLTEMVRASSNACWNGRWSPSRIAIWISATTNTLRCPVSTTATASTSAIWSPNWVYSPAACPAHSQRLSFATAPALCAPPESR